MRGTSKRVKSSEIRTLPATILKVLQCWRMGGGGEERGFPCDRGTVYDAMKIASVTRSLFEGGIGLLYDDSEFFRVRAVVSSVLFSWPDILSFSVCLLCY